MTRASLRVLMPFVGDTIGGSHLSALALVEALRSSAGVEPVIGVHEEGPLTDYLTHEGLDSTLLGRLSYVGRRGSHVGQLGAAVSSSPRVVRLLRNLDVDLVHTNDMRMHLTWSPPSRLAGVRSVWHQRTRFPLSRLSRLALRSAGVVVTISGFVRESLPAAARDTAVVIPNPVAPPGDRSAARQRLRSAVDSDPGDRLVGFVGNLTTQKRPEVFVRAAIRVCAEEPRTRFVLIGDDRESSWTRLRDAAEAAGVAGRIHYLGVEVPATDWIPGFDAVAAPGVNEGSGRVVLEAAVAGVPVVASRSGGHLEIVRHGETGWLVEADDPGGLAEVLRFVLSGGPAVDDVTQRAARQVVREHGLLTHAERIAAVYQKLLGIT